MPTMKQKVDRIDAARLAQISAVNTKNPNANLPTTTGIEDIAPAILTIPSGGGGEDYSMFITRGDFPGLFKNQNLNDDANLQGLRLFNSNGGSANGEGDMSHIFDGASDSNIDGTKDPTQYMGFPVGSTVTDLSYAYYNFTLPSDYRYEKEIDFGGAWLVDGPMPSLFENVGNNGQSGLGPATPILRIKLTYDCMEYATDINKAFYNTGAGFILVLDDNYFDLLSLTNGDYAFAYMGGATSTGGYTGSFEDENGNQIHEITFNLPTGSSASYTLNRFLKYNKSIQRAHFNSTAKCTQFAELIHNCQNLLSIDGLDFSGCTSATINVAGTSNSLSSIGKFGIINGSNIGTAANAKLNLRTVWNASASEVRDGQTVAYWYEQFANSLGQAAGTGQGILINSLLLNSLTSAQKELITNKGYTLAS